MLKNRSAVVALDGCKDVAHLICAAALAARTLLIEILMKAGQSGHCAICKHFNYPPTLPKKPQDQGNTGPLGGINEATADLLFRIIKEAKAVQVDSSITQKFQMIDKCK